MHSQSQGHARHVPRKTLTFPTATSSSQIFRGSTCKTRTLVMTFLNKKNYQKRVLTYPLTVVTLECTVPPNITQTASGRRIRICFNFRSSAHVLGKKMRVTLIRFSGYTFKCIPLALPISGSTSAADGSRPCLSSRISADVCGPAASPVISRPLGNK